MRFGYTVRFIQRLTRGGSCALACMGLWGVLPAVAAEPVDPSWLAKVQQSLAEKEYEASRNGEGLQAPNRAHDLRTYFEPTGIRVVGRTDPASPRLVELNLAAWGRGEDLPPVSPGEVSNAGARVEIARPGLVEWYRNTASGLEQGFDVKRRPEGAGALVLELAVSGARASLAGSKVVLVSDAGRRLEYGKLQVLDADGTAVASHLAVPALDRVRLVVDDADATYPLVIDPILTAADDAQLVGNQLEARMGGSVASAGDVNADGYADVIVGAQSYDAGEVDEGAAFVFLGGPSGIASGDPADADAQLESDQAGGHMGISVAAAGDVNGDGYADVIVGAYDYTAGQTAEGAAFVFLGSAGGIVGTDPGTAHAQLESDQALADFGYSVAGAGDVDGDGYADVIVGALLYTAGQTQEGAIFVFHGSVTGIASGNPASADAQIESDQALAHLGVSVAGAGDVDGDGYADVIVGANGYNAGQSGEGAAFVFHGSASGIASGNVASADTQLEADQADAALGSSVAAAGDVNGDGYADVIVGAILYDAGQTDEGAAFVYHGSVSGITSGNAASADAQLESDQTDSNWGRSVSGAGDVNGDGYADVIVGALKYDAGQLDEGAAFVYHGSASGITSGNAASADAQLESDQAGVWFGYSVAGAGDVNGDGYADVIAGARRFDAGLSEEGAAFVYHGGNAGLITTAAAQLESNQSSAFLGSSVAGAGDVNGDGYADVIVGADSYDAGETDEGAAFVFHGSASGIASGDPTSAAAQLESDLADAFLGSSVAGAGDVNGDGYADVIVGAPGYHAGESNEGAAFVFLGSAGGIVGNDPGTAHAQLESNQAGAFLGDWQGVAGAGDVNGDGYADVIVGATGYNAGETDEGAAFVFHGSASGIASGDPTSAAAQLESNQANAYMGSVAGAGDVNGDGYADVIVGAYNVYKAFVFLGSAGGVVGNDPAELSVGGGDFGVSVAGAGDFNADGYADVVVGAPLLNSGQGMAFLYLGGPSGIPDATGIFEADGFFTGSASTASLGVVAGAGDVNGDGYADVIASEAYYGADAFLFLGRAVPSFSSNNFDLEIGSSGTIGSSLAGAGDVNGDGFADVIVGNPDYGDIGQSDEGAAFVYYGGGGETGRPVLTRQLRGGGDTTPVEPWGVAWDADDFQVRMTATHPEGRGRVKLEVEACGPGVPFGDVSCIGHVSSTWTDVTATSGGVTFTETVGGLSDQTLYRWRARVLHAPFRVTESGITPPPNPAHGPWRRLQGQAREADIATGDDGDGDSILDAVEDAGPNGGDANGDGTADSQQANVASLPEPGGGDYIALEALGGCSTLLDVMVLAEDQLPAPDPSYDYPHGLVEFEAPCETATIDLWFHGATSLASPYRKYGPTTPGNPGTTDWYTLPFPAATFGTDVIDGNTVAKVTLSLADNALGDDTGDDGTILDIGGPTPLPEPDAVLGLGACLAALALLHRRRRRREGCA